MKRLAAIASKIIVEFHPITTLASFKSVWPDPSWITLMLFGKFLKSFWLFFSPVFVLIIISTPGLLIAKVLKIFKVLIWDDSQLNFLS